MIRLSVLKNTLSHTIQQKYKKVQFQNFEAIFRQILSKKLKCILLFSSGIGSDGKLWCSDCREVEPLYNKMSQECKQINAAFYVFVSGDEKAWKDPKHTFRINKSLMIKTIPTLGYFNGEKISCRLFEQEILDQGQRKLIYQEFLKEQK